MHFCGFKSRSLYLYTKIPIQSHQNALLLSLENGKVEISLDDKICTNSMRIMGQPVRKNEFQVDFQNLDNEYMHCAEEDETFL